MVAGMVAVRFCQGGIVFYALGFALSVGSYWWLQARLNKQRTTDVKLYIPLVVCSYVAFFSFGAWRMWQAMPKKYLSLYAPDSLVRAYEAVVNTPVKRNAKGNYSCTVQLTRIKTAQGWLPANAQVQLFVQPDSLRNIAYADRLLISGTPQQIAPPKNPDGFNYQQMMRNKGIAYQHFVSPHQWQKVDAVGFSIRKWALQLQQWADQTIESAVQSPLEAGLASALIIGLKDELDDTLLRAYSATGIMHVLAVSGLHVGILFAVIGFLFGSWQHHRRGKFVFVGIVLTVLWGYALITGLSPSVMRAALMFSLLNLGQLFQRRNSSFNTLAFSAVVLLAYDPLMLFQVGFQLSYMAVAGIMYFYPKFYALWETRYWLADKVWQIVCVSAAAQLATFPLGVYYFHQFPTYFLLSNLFAVPLAFFILSSGLVVLVLSWNNWLTQLAGKLLKELVELNNYLAFAVESLPSSAIHSLHFTAIEVAAVYGIIICLAAFLAVRQKLWLIAALGCSLLFSIVNLWEQWQQARQQLVGVFHTSKYSSLLWIEGKQSFLLADSALLQQPQQIRSVFADFLLKRGIDWEQMPVLTPDKAEVFLAARPITGGMLYRRNGITVCYLYQRVRRLPPLPACDVLLIANNALQAAGWLPQAVSNKIQHIVVDGSNSFYNARQIKQRAAQLGLPCHAVGIDGAFVRHY